MTLTPRESFAVGFGTSLHLTESFALIGAPITPLQDTEEIVSYSICLTIRFLFILAYDNEVRIMTAAVTLGC